MKALSIRQPFAAAILACLKTTEYRSWTTAHRGMLLIHASMSLAMDAGFEDAFPDGGVDLPRGAIVGVVDLVDVIREEHDTMDGPIVGYAWSLANPRGFAEPIPLKGKLTLFDVPDNIVREALQAAAGAAGPAST
jgi:hypothetical protein